MIEWDSNQTREFRAKNPFGLSMCSYARRYGAVSIDKAEPDNLAIFPNIQSGIHASIDLLRDKYLIAGMFAPYWLGNRWAGDKTMKYGMNLASIMKVNPFFPLSFEASCDTLLKAMCIMENGNPARVIPVGFFGQFAKENL